jgi:hypothetical protein
MQLMPNKTILTGTVDKVEAAEDGWGANVEFTVRSSEPADGFLDFLGASPGDTVKVFAAEPGLVSQGAGYEVTATVLGGPGGERVVMEAARPLKARPGR